MLPDNRTALGSAVYSPFIGTAPSAVYVDPTSVPWDVVTLDTETGEVRTILEDGAFAAWCESGHILFTRSRDLLAARFDPLTKEVLGPPLPITSDLWTGSWHAGWFDVSRNGTLAHISGGGLLTAETRLVVLDSIHSSPVLGTTPGDSSGLGGTPVPEAGTSCRRAFYL